MAGEQPTTARGNTLAIRSPRLIGRRDELATLQAALHAAEQGRGGWLTIAGEAGIGKSRLVAEAAAQAAARAFAVRRGHCFEPDRTLPLGPLIDLLHAWSARQPPETLAALAASSPALRELLPELRRPSPAGDSFSPPDPEQAKRTLFAALARWLLDDSARAGDGTATPQLVILEDLHWCDDTTLDFLHTLVRRIATTPTLLLLTYRDDEAGERLRQALALLNRAQPAHGDLRLGRLDSAQVQDLIAAIFTQQAVRYEFAAALHALTDGNPFFIEETLKALVASGDIFFERGIWTRRPLGELRIPGTIRDAVDARTRRLDPDTLHLLRLAAVLGRRFDATILREIAACDEATLVAALRLLVGAHLIVEESADLFAFRHALIRQAIYGDLLARERRPLHRAIVAAMERRPGEQPGAHAAELAHHCFEGELWEPAVRHARLAGEHARALFAPHAAVEHFTRAIAAAGRLAAVPPGLHHERGQLHELLGALDAAREDYEREFAVANASGDRRAEWQALCDLGFFWTARDYQLAEGFLRRALALARMLDDPAMLAHSLTRIGNWYANMGRLDEAIGLHGEALGLFKQTGDRRGQATTLDLLATDHVLGRDMLTATRHQSRAIALFRALDDPQSLVTTLLTYPLRGPHYLGHTTVLRAIGTAEREREIEEALGISRRIASRPSEAGAAIYASFALGAAGRYARAFELVQHGLAIAEELGHRYWQFAGRMALGALALDLLDWEGARDHLERSLATARASGALDHRRMAASFLVSTEVGAGDLDRAGDLLASHLGDETNLRSVTVCNLLAGRAALALARGEPDRALDDIERVIAGTPHANPAADERGVVAATIPPLWRLRGEALLALGRAAEAEATLRVALAGARAYSAPTWAWRAHLALGKALWAQRRFEAAEEAFAAGRAVVTGLAADVPDDALRERFTARALAPLPSRAPTARRAAKRQAGGLTERERAVAALVARGQSNREIAAALSLGARTIETHVGNIMNKLGVTTRAQIAAWVAQRGEQPS